MSLLEFVGRASYYALRPIIHLFLRGSRRAYVVVQYDGKILVVKNILGSGKWHLPGGGCHRSESYEQSATRELKEEVGITLDSAQLESISDSPFRSKRSFDYRLFSVKSSQPIELNLDRREILEAQWVLPSELSAINTGESTLQAVQLLVHSN